MTIQEMLATQLGNSLKFFRQTTSAFAEDDSGFRPDPEMFTVAGHVAHAADEVDWLVEGAFGEGWDMDFEAIKARIGKVRSLGEANAWLARAFEAAIRTVERAGEEELLAPVPDERMMPGMPRAGIVNEIVDHTAHHRGSLAVYLRVMGRTPPTLYAE